MWVRGKFIPWGGGEDWTRWHMQHVEYCAWHMVSLDPRNHRHRHCWLGHHCYGWTTHTSCGALGKSPNLPIKWDDDYLFPVEFLGRLDKVMHAQHLGPSASPMKSCFHHYHYLHHVQWLTSSSGQESSWNWGWCSDVVGGKLGSRKSHHPGVCSA